MTDTEDATMTTEPAVTAGDDSTTPSLAVGTLVREDHLSDDRFPGCSIWLRVARWRPRIGTEYGWLCVQSDAPGNVLHEVSDEDAGRWSYGLELMPVVGTIPTSPADRAQDGDISWACG